METNAPDLRALAEEALSAAMDTGHALSGKPERLAADAAHERLFEAIEEREAALRRCENLRDQWLSLGYDGYRTNVAYLCGKDLDTALRPGKDGPQ